MDDQSLLRFSRQILLPEFGFAGQKCLADSCALIVGLGGLGSPVALYLAAAGFGTLILVDDDEVELANLQRQILHDTSTLHQPKVFSARQRLATLNPDCKLITHQKQLSKIDWQTTITQADVVLDCSDNFATRFLLNQGCYASKIPLVSGAAQGWNGQIGVFLYQPQQACYRCLYDDHTETSATCSENGIMAPIVGVIGSLQALEAIKIVSGVGNSLHSRLLLFDGLQHNWRTIHLQADPACPVCHSHTQKS
jgi:adenylyltransferase/sulfurtransferase